MTIDKAIEILSHDIESSSPTLNPDYKDARKLGLEALKQVKDCMSGEVLSPGFMLPSETEE